MLCPAHHSFIDHLTKLSVFILTWVCINTPVMRALLLSDHITSFVKQTPPWEVGTQRSRPLTGGFSQNRAGSGMESEWLSVRQNHHDCHEWGDEWGWGEFFVHPVSESDLIKNCLKFHTMTARFLLEAWGGERTPRGHESVPQMNALKPPHPLPV